MSKETTIQGANGEIFVRLWGSEATTAPRYIAIIAHGFAEHGGRYEHVAAHLVKDGAVVYAPDHFGHGRSPGEKGVVIEIDVLASDLHRVVVLVKKNHPKLPVVLVGHSMGGLISTRYVQLHPGELTALVLSGPVVGGNPGFEALLAMDPIPPIPLDPTWLSRDPSVGDAYAADPLVYHGPLVRLTLQSLFDSVAKVREGAKFGSLPTLWMHGENDQLAPLEVSKTAVERLKGETWRAKVFAGAAHEIFNETNKEEVLLETTDFIHGVLETRK